MDESIPPHFIELLGTNRLRLTEAGRDAYRARFATAGITVDAIRTREGLIEALRASHGEFIASLKSQLDDMPGNTCTKALLSDILDGRYRLSEADEKKVKEGAAADYKATKKE